MTLHVALLITNSVCAALNFAVLAVQLSRLNVASAFVLAMSSFATGIELVRLFGR